MSLAWTDLVLIGIQQFGQVAAGGEIKEEGDALLCTVPLGVLSQIETQPELSAAKRRAIRQINYDSGTKVLALAGQRFWEIEDGIYGGGTIRVATLGARDP